MPDQQKSLDSTSGKNTQYSFVTVNMTIVQEISRLVSEDKTRNLTNWLDKEWKECSLEQQAEEDIERIILQEDDTDDFADIEKVRFEEEVRTEEEGTSQEHVYNYNNYYT